MGTSTKKQDRLDKRAEALRENLRKRKALKKAQKDQPAKDKKESD